MDAMGPGSIAATVLLIVCTVQPPPTSQPPQQPPPDVPRRVVPGEQSETKTIYREVKAGEERVEGLLQRINCPPGKPVTFVVKARDQVVTFTSPRLDAVEFIAHNPNFRGPVSCGGYTPAEHVFVTSKKVNGAAKPVAIEFLPK
jgi:hypothetical protein